MRIEIPSAMVGVMLSALLLSAVAPAVNATSPREHISGTGIGTYTCGTTTVSGAVISFRGSFTPPAPANARGPWTITDSTGNVLASGHIVFLPNWGGSPAFFTFDSDESVGCAAATSFPQMWIVGNCGSSSILFEAAPLPSTGSGFGTFTGSVVCTGPV